MPPFPRRGPREDDIGGRPKIDKMLPSEDTESFWGPGERSGGIEAGNLQEIAVRTLWDHSRGPKPDFVGPNIQKIPDFPGYRAEIITY